MADFIQEAEQLRAELNQANYEYYVLDNPTMSGTWRSWRRRIQS